MDGSRPLRDTQKRVKSISFSCSKKIHPSFIMVRDVDDIHEHINFSSENIIGHKTLPDFT